MVNGDSSAVLRHVRALFGAGAAGGMSDGQLLDRFRRRGGDPDAEAAFAVLVARYGPMVFGVCRRALGDPHDAADAFQATFLVLVRKAGSVRGDDSLGRWLYGVSRRVAAKAKAVRARRAAREGSESGPEPAGPEWADEAERRELLAALDEEVSRLPEPFRAAVMLCDLGGWTQESAAQQFGCPVGTVESRLSRGRKRLRERLARRGLAPMLAGPAGLAPPVVPEALSVGTVQAATHVASVSAAVCTLIEGVITDMAWTTIKTLALGLGAVTVACGLAIPAVHRLQAEDNPTKSPAHPAATPEKPRDAATVEAGESDWMGKQVITKLGAVLQDVPRVGADPKPAANAKDGERPVIRVYQVEKASGPWLWLVDEKPAVSGWVPVAQVVPYDRAIDYFTGVIRAEPKRVAAYRWRGILWHWKEEYDQAIADFTEAIRIDPKNAEAFNDRGDAWYAKEDFGKAIADYTEALRLDPKDAMAFNFRGDAWRAMGDVDKAIADYTEAIRLVPEYADAYFSRGSAWAAQGDDDKAIADFTETIRLDPNDAPADLCRGNAWREKREYDKAIADFTETIRLNPKDAPAYLSRGNAWSAKTEYDKAIADFTEMIRLEPKNAPYISRGDAWKSKGEHDKAIADFNQAIQLDPKDGMALCARGGALQAKGEEDKAIADFNQAIQLDPKNSMVYVSRGAYWSERKDYDKAIADFTEAIQIDPKDAGANLSRGNAWSEKREYDKAITDLTETIRLEPKHAPYINRALAWSEKRDYAKAIADFTEAIRIDPKHAWAYNYCAWIWATCPDAKHRDGKRAVEAAARACALTADKDADTLGTLAAAYAESGDFDAAAKWQEKVVGMYTGEAALLKEASARLALYQAKKPYRQDREVK